MRQAAIRRKQPGIQDGHISSLAAPIKGLNTRDPVSAMDASYAVELENWFPMPAGVAARAGSSDWVTGFAAVPKTLMAYQSPTASKLFAATDAGIYDVTIAGVVGASVTALTNGNLNFVNATSLGGSYLLAVNGTDKLKLYDGATWADIDNVSVPAITGLATTSIANLTVHGRRIWVIQKNSMSAWYLPVNVISGALTEFPLGQLFKRGGKLKTLFTWTVDGGQGQDDFLCFLSSEGELAVYAGVDPTTSTGFALQGVYYVGIPVSDRCQAKYGGDVFLVTQDGAEPLSKSLQTASINRSLAFSDAISQKFTDAAQNYGGRNGWQVLVWPTGNLAIVNIPTAEFQTADQYVMNTITGAWTVFTGWNAISFEQLGTSLFFSTSNKICKAWTGTSDSGAAITFKCRQAYNYFGTRKRKKHLKLIRPIFTYNSGFSATIGVSADFANLIPTSTLTFPNSPFVGVWDSAVWDTSLWGDPFTSTDWTSVEGQSGYCLSLFFSVTSSISTIMWSSTDYVVESGGVL